MSVNTVAARAERPVLAVVPAPREASVSSIFDAPSARRRRERLRAEDPAMRRRPRRRAAVEVSRGRSRLLSGLGSAALCLVLSVGAAGAGLALQHDADPTAAVVHHVVAGESVWSLAENVVTDRPLEDVVSDIRALNDIDGGLRVGQEVLLPAE